MVNVIDNPSFEEFFTIHPWEFDGDFRIVPDPALIPPVGDPEAPEPGLFSFEARSDGVLAQHIGSELINASFPILAFLYKGIAPLGVTVYYTAGAPDWTRLNVDTWNRDPVPNFDGWGIALLPVDTNRPVRRLEINIDAPRPRINLDCFFLDSEGDSKMRPGAGGRYRRAMTGTDWRKMTGESRPDSTTLLDAHLFTVEKKLDKLLRLLEPPGPAPAKVKPTAKAKPAKKAAGKTPPKKASAARRKP